MQTAGGFGITLLTTSTERTTASFPDIPGIVEVDYTSPTSIITAFRSLPTPPSETALLVLINRDQADPQIALIDAAATVGIAHILPSSFGNGDPDNAYLRDFPPLAAKYKMEDHVVRLGSESKVSYTCINTGAFLDWALDRGLYANLINAPGMMGAQKGTTMVFDDGDVKFSATMLEDIGKAILGVVKSPVSFRNRNIRIHSAVITQNQLLAYAKELAPEREFPTMGVDTAVLERAARAKFEAGERGPQVMSMFMPRPTFGLRMGLFENVANEELGIEVYGEADVKALVARYLHV